MNVICRAIKINVKFKIRELLQWGQYIYKPGISFSPLQVFVWTVKKKQLRCLTSITVGGVGGVDLLLSSSSSAYDGGDDADAAAAAADNNDLQSLCW